MKLLVLSLMILACSIPAVAQDEYDVKLPDRVMEQVVKRVVGWYFKPSGRQRTVYFADRFIKAEWLPKIKNVKFVLFDDEEVMDRDKGVHLFKRINLFKGIYTVWYGFGDPNCSGFGDVWKVRVREDRTLIWKEKGSHWSDVCGTSRERPTP